MARVLVVEDTPDIARLVQRALQRALQREGLAVDLAADGAAALALLEHRPPDLIVLDRMLPDLDGIELARQVRADAAGRDRPPPPILMLTALGGVTDRVAGLEAGADDYLAKPFAVAELLARGRALLRRVRDHDLAAAAAAPPAAEAPLQLADLVVDPAARTAARGVRPLRLTAREFDLLLLLLRHPNRVLPHAFLMKDVWGQDFYGESNVLAVTIAAIRRASEAGGEPRLIQTVRNVGYVLRPPA